MDTENVKRGLNPAQATLSISAIPASGSQRRYYRLRDKDGLATLLCVSPNLKENETFVRLAEYLEVKGIYVPKIISVAQDISAYLLEDLGETDLLSVIKGSEKFPREILEKTVRQLVAMQRLHREEWAELVEFPPMDAELIDFDFRYAVTNLFDPMLTDRGGYDAECLEKEFSRLKEVLLSYPAELWGLMYRDFQSRNVMVRYGLPYFIDFQSSRFGPGIYDLVSFAWQAKAGFTAEEREEIIETYAGCMETYVAGCTKVIKESVPFWAMFRIIQTLGAYGLRGLKEGKPHFIQSIPPALANLHSLMVSNGLDTDFQELKHIIDQLIYFFNK